MSPRVRRSLKTFILVVGILALVVGAMRYVFNPQNLERYTAMELRLSKLRAMNERLAHENDLLARRIEACRHDPRYLERVARHELRYVRDGDEVYLFQ